MALDAWLRASEMAARSPSQRPSDDPEFTKIVYRFQHGEISLNEALKAVDELKLKQQTK